MENQYLGPLHTSSFFARVLSFKGHFFICFFSIIQSQNASQKILETAINKNNEQSNNDGFVKKKIDSLLHIISLTKMDTSKVKLYLHMSGLVFIILCNY